MWGRKNVDIPVQKQTYVLTIDGQQKAVEVPQAQCVDVLDEQMMEQTAHMPIVQTVEQIQADKDPTESYWICAGCNRSITKPCAVCARVICRNCSLVDVCVQCLEQRGQCADDGRAGVLRVRVKAFW